MKAKYIKIINLIVALLVALFCVGQVFAWLADKRYEDDNNFGGSSASPYFAYGDGTAVKKDVNGDAWDPSSGVEWDKKTGPYGLDSYNHLYNLAWLQNTGRFFDSSTQQETQYYFELAGNITLQGDYWLPPIGNDEHPFIGVFDGNGKKIINLHITTDKNKLTAKPVGSSYQFSNAVGLFGNTGETSKIKNFILESPYVEAPAVGDTDVDTSYSSLRNKAIGLAIGHVAGLAQSIGVYAHSETQTFLSASKEYTTFNSILGELAKGKDSSVTGGGHGEGSSGGSGSNFGGSFDVDNLLDRLYKIKANKESGSASSYLPNLHAGSGDDKPVLAAAQEIPFSVTEESTYEGSEAKEVIADNNIGYYIGSQNKINDISLKFGEPLGVMDENGDYYNPNGEWANWTDSNGKTPYESGNVPKWFYWWDSNAQTANENAYKTGSGLKPLTKAQMDALPAGIKEIISGENYNSVAIRLNQIVAWSRYNYASDSVSNDFYWSDHGAISLMGKTYGSKENPVALPNNGIWFKPVHTGKIRFVMYVDSKHMGHDFALVKLKRAKATKDNPFLLESGDDIHFLDANNEETGPEKPTAIMSSQLLSNVLAYFEYEVTQEDLDLGAEFLLGGSKQNTNYGYFLYMDIGSNAEVDNDNGEIVEDKISAIDFIYKDVEIAQSAGTGFKVGDFIVGGALYEKSHTSIYFEKIADALTIVYIRLANEGGKNMSISTKSAEVHATYPEYVTGLVE